MRPVRLFVIHRHLLLAEVLETALAREDGIVVVGSSADPASVSGVLRELDVDIVLIEPKLDKEASRPTIRKLNRHYPDVKVLALDPASDAEIAECLAAGASAYLPGDAGLADAVETIRAVHIGLPPTNSDGFVAAVLRRVVRLREALPTNRPASFGLTRREREVLGLLSEQRSNQEIAEELGIALATVKIHLHRIFRKLGVHNRQEAMATAREASLLD